MSRFLDQTITKCFCWQDPELIRYRKRNFVDAVKTLKALAALLKNGCFDICDAVILFTSSQKQDYLGPQ
ncbi:hypothetical protein V5799_017626 [Amblyomma americanum]|uniref:Uncharacterized protein n=1 Tax=Amblyomma americanum TaxID=6943 RepID=A0AAQ4F2P8_AMBAM